MGELGETLARAMRGDSDAVGLLHREFSGAVSARVRRRLTPVLRRYYDTDDLADSVFGEVLRDISRFENRGLDAFRNWLLVKVESKVREKYRKVYGPRGIRRQDLLAPQDADRVAAVEPDPQHVAESREDAERAAGMLAELDAIDAEVVRMRSVEDLPFDVIARSLGLGSADAARKRFVRAMLRLRLRAERE